MKSYYRVHDGKIELGSTIDNQVPVGFTEYTAGQEPAELKDYLDSESIKTMIKQGEAVVEAHIQEPIIAYNKAHGVSFGSVHNCANYKDHPTYAHALFCTDIWNFNVSVWESARASLTAILLAGEPYPTDVEFKAMLPTYMGTV